MAQICFNQMAAALATVILASLAHPALASGEAELAAAMDYAADHRYAIALAHFRLSAEQGNVQAQRSLGLMLLKGETLYGSEVASSRAEALKWLSLAASKGCGVSKFVLARLNSEGESTGRLVSMK